MAKEPRRLRVYQQWQGNERFFCWGHCVTGPSWKSGMGSLLLLFAPTVVFLVFVAPYMAARVTPAIMVISCVLPVFCASMLLMTSCRDPGILPRQEPDEEWLQGRKARAKDVLVNGHRVTVRYNDTCHFYQPPRAHHCSVNDNCIERFDHHCPWVGTTIGKRNYRTFLLFIYSTSIYIAWTFGVCLGSLFVKHRELVAAATASSSSGDSTSSQWLNTLGQSGAAIALMGFTFLFFWFVCGLSGFHTWLVATNQTTYENFRYNHNQVPNPYDEGFLGNCASVWCVRVPPSKVQFRAYVDEVRREPVELGFPEWNGAAMGSPLQRTGLEAGQQQAYHPPEPLAVADPVAAAAAAQDKLAQARLVGLGSRESVLPVQGYDSITEGSSQAPIGRTDARSGHSMLVGTVANSTASNSNSSAYHNPYYGVSPTGGSVAVEQPGLHGQAPFLQQQQQQQYAGAPSAAGLAAPAMQAMVPAGTGAAGSGVAAQPPLQQQGSAGSWGSGQQQQMLPRTFSPLSGHFSPLGSGGAVDGLPGGSAAASPEHVGIEMAGVTSNGDTIGSMGSNQLQQQHQQHTPGGPLHDIRSPRAVSPARRSSAAAFSSTGGVDSTLGSGMSTATEYADARQSEGSWASRDDEVEDLPGEKRRGSY